MSFDGGTIQAVGVLVAAIALAVNGFFFYLRLKHDNASRSIAASAALVRQWRDSNTQEAVRFIYSELRKKYPDSSVGYSNIADDKDRAIVTRVSHLCDEIAARTILGEANPEFIIAFIGPAIIRMATVLGPYLAAERELRNQGARPEREGDYQVYLTRFAERVAKVNIRKLTETHCRRFERKRI